MTFNVVNSQERKVGPSYDTEDEAWSVVAEYAKFSKDSYEVYPVGTDEELAEWEANRE